MRVKAMCVRVMCITRGRNEHKIKFSVKIVKESCWIAPDARNSWSIEVLS